MVAKCDVANVTLEPPRSVARIIFIEAEKKNNFWMEPTSFNDNATANQKEEVVDQPPRMDDTAPLEALLETTKDGDILTAPQVIPTASQGASDPTAASIVEVENNPDAQAGDRVKCSSDDGTSVIGTPKEVASPRSQATVESPPIPRRRESIAAESAEQSLSARRSRAKEEQLDHGNVSTVVCFGCRAHVRLEVLQLHQAACLGSLDQFFNAIHRHPLCGLLAFPRPPKTMVPVAGAGQADDITAYSLEAIRIFDATLGGCKGCSSMFPVRDLPQHFSECPRRFFTTSQPCPILVQLPNHDAATTSHLVASPSQQHHHLLSPSSRYPTTEVPERSPADRTTAAALSSSPRGSSSHHTGLTPYKMRLQLYPPSPGPSVFTVGRSPVFRSQRRNEATPRCRVCDHQVMSHEELVAEEIRRGKEQWDAQRLLEASKKLSRDRRRKSDYALFHPPAQDNGDARRDQEYDEDDDSLVFDDAGSAELNAAAVVAASGRHSTIGERAAQTEAEPAKGAEPMTPESVEFYEEES